MGDPSPGGSSADPLLEALTDLRRLIASLSLTVGVEGAESARRLRDELVSQLDDYLIPRAASLNAPLLAVVGGSTGAGKSTLVNSLVGEEVSAAGVLRPTTTAPVLVCSPGDVRWFETDRVLPSLRRFTGGGPPAGAHVKLVVHPRVPDGVALLDAPDIDSVVKKNRVLAGELLRAADMWLFVTTAARYADAVPWEFLREASRRSMSLAVVLNRVPAPGLTAVKDDLARMLNEAGFAHTPLFPLPETSLDEGLVPEASLASLRNYIDRLAGDAQVRAETIRRTLDGALADLGPRAEALANHVEEEIEAASRLQDWVAAVYDKAVEEARDALAGGDLLRGEVLARWYELVGTGDLMRAVQGRITWLRDRVVSFITGREATAEEVRAAVETTLETLIVGLAARAAERAVATWEMSPAGKALLEGRGGQLERPSPSLAGAATEQTRAWQRRVLVLVSEEGASKRQLGRVLSIGVNAIGAALMLAVFAQTGGLTGGEVAIAGGTAAVGQKILEALFGDEAVRRLTAEARADLLRRIEELLDVEAERFFEAVDAVTPAGEEPRMLRQGVSRLQEVRA
ncbi:MAG TPA: ABC transporter [Actinomycetota bacterium]|nr:ABC transporter [Actinomycetota bacterium]